MIHIDQFLRHTRLVHEYIETRRKNGAVLQRLNSAPARPLPIRAPCLRDAVWTKRLQQLGIDQVFRCSAAGTITISVSMSRAMSISFE